jgi:hypothetical protein
VSAAGTSPGTRMADVVVDASVVIKWHVPEIHSDAALRLLRDDGPALHVPDLLFAEVGNILGLVHIADLHSLRTLNLAGTAISDAGLSHLHKLTGLRSLVLWGTRVTDAGLMHLHALTGLRELDLERTRVSPTGLAELRRALPQAEIVA